MSLTSHSDILQRLKRLKEWQESQEELLKKTKNAINTSANSTTGSDYQTIQGLSAFDSSINEENSPKKSKDWESQVISPTKTFNELLEERLAQDPGPVNVAPKEKKPYLRKGTGLVRFRLKPQKSKKANKSQEKTTKQVTNDTVTPLRAPDVSIKPKATWSKIDDSNDHVRKTNSIAQCETSEPSEQTLWEKQIEKELLVFEALEQKANNSSFCSTNSDVIRILSSTPSKITPRIPEEKRVHWESQSDDEETIETNLERKHLTELFLRLAESKARRENLPTITDESEDEKSSEHSSDSSSVASTDLESTLKREKCDIGVGTNEYSPDTCPLCGDEIQQKINEYENKIKEVIQDKNRVADLKKQLEQKDREFLKKKREFDDERQDLIFELETEKKKLLKERQAFQMFMKDSQNRPNKKERQEISNLKQEVADLTETLKLKESKNGMCQARLRNQVKQLEKENSNLKDEVEKLTKENAKLSAAQKLNRKSSETKILHEINKNITKLTKESLKNNQKSDDKGRKSDTFVTRNKMLDVEDSFLEIGKKDNEVETQYENTFRSQSLPLPGILKTADNKSEITLDDRSKQIKYPNGNVKTISPDGNLIKIQYFNGDKQETNLLDGTVKYYFSSKNICQTTFADGLEVVEFPEGVIEKQYKDGRCEIILPDGVIQTTFPNGSQETKYTDGSIVKINKSGEKVLLLPNGQKEIETKEYKRREYPDGTVKILYPDGTQETKYSNGRVRIKDGNGTLILDTQS